MSEEGISHRESEAEAGQEERAGYGRAQAWQVLTEWTAGESLRKHALAVEACVPACGEAAPRPSRRRASPLTARVAQPVTVTVW